MTPIEWHTGQHYSDGIWSDDADPTAPNSQPKPPEPRPTADWDPAPFPPTTLTAAQMQNIRGLVYDLQAVLKMLEDQRERELDKFIGAPLGEPNFIAYTRSEVAGGAAALLRWALDSHKGIA